MGGMVNVVASPDQAEGRRQVPGGRRARPEAAGRHQRRRVGFVLVAGLALVAACSSPKGAESRGLLTQPVPPRHAGPLSPIASLATAAGLTTSGDPVGVSADFGATDPDIVAVIDVGELSSQTHEPLTVTWSTAPPHGTARVLFAQTVSVASGDVAYAAALNPGRMLLGVYRVDATLAGVHRSAWFIVDDPDGPLGAATPAAGAPAQAATAGPTVEPASYVNEDATTPTVEANATSGMGTAGPPTDGPTGTVTPPSAPTGGTGCQLAINGNPSGTVMVDWSGCPGDDVAISATVNGQTQLVQTAHAADASVPVRVDPCSVDPSIGYGNTSITYAAKVVSGPDSGKSAAPVSGTQSLQSPTDPPSLIPVEYTPEIGSQVDVGEPILLTLEARSAVGIRSVTVTADPGGTVAQQTYRQRPTRCTTAGTDQIVVVPPYRVPSNPPPLVTITAVATDFAGTSKTLDMTYSTRAVWLGTALGDGMQNYGTKLESGVVAGLCTAHWVMNFQVDVPATKAISGAAQASTSLIRCHVVGSYPLPPSFPGGVSTFNVTGSYDGTIFKLQFPPVHTNQAFTLGSLYLIDTNGAGRTTLVLTRTTATRADGNLNLSLGTLGVIGVPVNALNLAASLYCCSPNAGPVRDPTKTPPIFIQ